MPSDPAFPQSNVPPALHVPQPWQIDPANDGRIGVLCGPALYTFTSKDPGQTDPAPEGMIPFAGEGLPELLRVASRSKLSAIWLVPLGASIGRLDAPLLRGWTGQTFSRDRKLLEKSFSLHELTARGGRGGEARFAGIVARALNPTTGKPTGAVIRVIAPWVQDQWRLPKGLPDLSSDPIRRASQFAGSVLRAAFALGAQLRFSPSYVGLSMLRQELGRWQRRGVDFTLDGAWRERFDALRATPIQWARPGEKAPPPALGTGPTPAVTLWKYDRNGSYVASAREVPTGPPLPLDGRKGLMATEKLPMGLYQVRATPPAWFDPAKLPGPFREHNRWTGSPEAAWTWEPQIRLAQRHGWTIELLDGWFWPKSHIHDLFRSWQTRIFAARAATEGDRIANGIVKQVGVATIGRLVSTGGRAVVTEQEAERRGLPILWRVSDAGKPTGMVEVELEAGRVDLIRPDWWSLIIANAVERLLERAYTVGRETTVLLYVDALYSTMPIAELAGPPDKPGGFKLEAARSVPASVLRGGDPVATAIAFANGEELPDGA